MLPQTKFRLNEINKFKYSFNSKIQKRKIMTKKLNKYIATFDYFDKIVLSVTSEAISIISFTSVIGILVGIASVTFNLKSSLTTEITRKLFKITRKRKNIKFLSLLKVN